MAVYVTEGGQFLSAYEIRDIARNVGFPGTAADHLAAIAQRESSPRGWTRSHNAKPPDDSWGLYQINLIVPGGHLARWNNDYAAAVSCCTDPQCSTKFAYDLWRTDTRGDGFSAWTTNVPGTLAAFLKADGSLVDGLPDAAKLAQNAGYHITGSGTDPATGKPYAQPGTDDPSKGVNPPDTSQQNTNGQSDAFDIKTAIAGGAALIIGILFVALGANGIIRDSSGSGVIGQVVKPIAQGKKTADAITGKAASVIAKVAAGA